MVVAFEQVLTCCSVGSCCFSVIAGLSIAVQELFSELVYLICQKYTYICSVVLGEIYLVNLHYYFRLNQECTFEVDYPHYWSSW